MAADPPDPGLLLTRGHTRSPQGEDHELPNAPSTSKGLEQGEDHEATYWREKYESAVQSARAWQRSYDGLAARVLAPSPERDTEKLVEALRESNPRCLSTTPGPTTTHVLRPRPSRSLT